MRAVLFSLVIVLLCSLSKAMADEASYLKMKSEVEALFHMGNDFVDVKIAIDKIIDPTIESTALRKQFDEYASPLLDLAQNVQGDHNRLKVLRQFLYQPGYWNDNRPLQYDHTDPDAKIREHKFLSYLVEARSGSCSTMPLMLMLLGRQLGLRITLSTLPRHVFAKITDEQGKVWNLEATSGAGYTRDAYYREQFQVSEKAIASGAYMATQTDEQTIGKMALFIGEWMMMHDKPEEAIAAFKVILTHDPKNVHALLGRGSSFALILERDILSKYKSKAEMTPEQLQDAQFLSDMNGSDFTAAEALGWNADDDLKSIVEAKKQAAQQQ